MIIEFQPLLCAGSPTTRPGCPEPHPAWANAMGWGEEVMVVRGWGESEGPEEKGHGWTPSPSGEDMTCEEMDGAKRTRAEEWQK